MPFSLIRKGLLPLSLQGKSYSFQFTMRKGGNSQSKKGKKIHIPLRGFGKRGKGAKSRRIKRKKELPHLGLRRGERGIKG